MKTALVLPVSTALVLLYPRSTKNLMNPSDFQAGTNQVTSHASNESIRTSRTVDPEIIALWVLAWDLNVRRSD